MKKLLLSLICTALTILIKAQSPTFQWAKQMGGPATDHGNSIAVDFAGNVYTIGYFYGTVDFDPGSGTYFFTSGNSGANADIFISKLDATGNFIWAKQIGGTGTYDYAFGISIAVDVAGNVYTTGSYEGTVDFNPGAGIFNLTAAGVTGSVSMFVSKLDVNGNFIWAKNISGTGTYSARGSSIALDVSGNVYTTGTFMGTVDFNPGTGTFNLTSLPNNWDMYLSKLDASGNFVWAKNIQGNATSRAQGNYLTLDALGNVFITGSFQGTVDFDPGLGTDSLTSAGGNDIFILKTNALGNLVWAKSIGGTSADNGNSLAVDVLGNVYTTGSFQGSVDFDPGAGTDNLVSTGVNDIFISKLDSIGNFIWAKNIGGTGTSNAYGYSIALDTVGNVYTTGSFSGTTDFDPGVGVVNLTSVGTNDIFISKLNVSGNFVWAEDIGGSGSGAAVGIKLDSANNVYTVGSFQGTLDFDPSVGIFNLTSAGNNDIFVQKMSQSSVTTRIIESSKGNSISISPNPFTSQTTISFSEIQKNTTIKIMDVVGKEIKNAELILKNEKNTTLDMSGYAKGVYFLQIIDANKNVVNRKVVVE